MANEVRVKNFFKHKNLRNSHQRCSIKKGVLKNFIKFTGKHLCQSFFFNKVSGLRTAALLKKMLWHRCFPVNFAKFLRTPFYRTLLDVCFCNLFSNCVAQIHVEKLLRKYHMKVPLVSETQRIMKTYLIYVFFIIQKLLWEKNYRRDFV